MSILLEFSIAPGDKGESLSPYVARAIDVIDKSGVPYRLHAMGTVIETDSLALAFAVVQKCFDALAPDCHRISITLKVDYRKGKSGCLAAKPASVEQKLGRTLKTT